MFYCPCGLPLSLENGDGLCICSWPPTGLSSTRRPPPMYYFLAFSGNVVLCFSFILLPGQTARGMKVSGLSAELFWPGRMPRSWLPGNRKGGVINFYAYHCQDHLPIWKGRLEMSPCKLSQSFHLSARLAILHSAWHSNKRRVQKGSNSPGWWTGGIGPINCSL